MKRLISLAVSMMMLASSFAYASEPYYIKDEEKVTLIVEVEGEPLLASMQAEELLVDTDAEEELLKKQAQVMAHVNDTVADDAKIGFVYTALFNGFSMEAERSQIEEIKALPGVKNVYVSGVNYIVEPMLESAGELTYTQYSYDRGYDGEGTAIAIIDAGCDTGHKFFEAAIQNPKYTEEDIADIITKNTLNSKVTTTKDIYKNAKIPYAYNYVTGLADTYISGQNHGTHVAGIAAGKKGTAPDGSVFSGVAPEAQLLIMSCGDSRGVLYDDAILAGINDAAILGADVINMSFGIDYLDSLEGVPYGSIIAQAHDAGISIISSAGNSSRGYLEEVPLVTNPDYSAGGMPNALADVTSVASADNVSRFDEYWALVTPGETEYKAYASHDDSPITSIFTDGEYIEYVDCNLGKAADFEGKNLTGKIALVKRGDISFVEKSDNAAAAGAVGIIIYNTTDEVFGCANALSLPGATVTLSTGNALLDDNNKKLRYDGVKTGSVPVETGGKVSSYSSWGVDSTLQLKPEITAPGGSIYSSVNGDKYASMSGTSMASPHMAGITALSLEYYRSDPFAAEYNDLTGEARAMLLENIAMNSAEIIRQDSSVPYSPRLQGAGLVNMKNMINSKVLITGDSGKAKLSLGDDLTDKLAITFDITNISNEEITFDKISVEAMTDGYTQIGGEYYVGDTVSLDVISETLPENITLASGETRKIKATVTLDAAKLAANADIFTNGFFIDGYVILDSEDASVKASMPFTGFYGDWGAAPVFDSTIYDEGGSNLTDPEATGDSGTYIAARFSDGYMTLGRNPYFTDILDEKYIAYSANGGYQIMPITKNYRTIDSWSYSILNTNGNTVVKGSGEAVFGKFNSIGYTFTKSKTDALPEGNYTVCVTAGVAGNTETTDELKIPFVVDNTYPQIMSAEYDEESETVTITAKDNHYLAMVYAYYTKTDGTESLVKGRIEDEDYTQGETVSLTLDVSNAADKDSIQIGGIDYAMNESYFALEYFTDKIGAEISDLVRLEGVTTAALNLRNNTEKEITARFILAFYDDSGRLIALSNKEEAIAADTDESIKFSMLSDTRDAASVKVFVWDWKMLKSYDTAKHFILE